MNKSNVIMLVFIIGIIYYGVYHTLMLPEVRFSNVTGECVEVINYDDSFQYTCENYPEKYHHVIVQ